MGNMVEQINVQTIILLGVVVIGLWEFIKKVIEMLKAITSQHDKIKKWDSMEDRLLKNIQEERDKIYANYDPKLEEIRKEIDVNHADTESKIQQLTSMMILLMKSVNAMLEREIKQGANGEVKKMHDELNDFLYDEIGK